MEALATVGRGFATTARSDQSAAGDVERCDSSSEAKGQPSNPGSMPLVDTGTFSGGGGTWDDAFGMHVRNDAEHSEEQTQDNIFVLTTDGEALEMVMEW